MSDFLMRHWSPNMPNWPDWQLWLTVWVFIFFIDFLFCFGLAAAYNRKFQWSMHYAWGIGDSLFLPTAVASQAVCLKYFEGSNRWYTTILFQLATIILGVIVIVTLVWQFKLSNDKLPPEERAPLMPWHAWWHHVVDFVPLFWFILAMLIPAFAAPAPPGYRASMTIAYLFFLGTNVLDQERHLTGELPIPGRNY